MAQTLHSYLLLTETEIFTDNSGLTLRKKAKLVATDQRLMTRIVNVQLYHKSQAWKKQMTMQIFCQGILFKEQRGSNEDDVVPTCHLIARSVPTDLGLLNPIM